MGHKPSRSTARRIIAVIIAMTAIAFILNSEVSISQGIDGRVRTIKMPLYVKWVQFLARHYEYVRLSREITAGCRTDEEKALAILAWTGKNIRDLPPGMPVVDDHIATIIIRGHGVPEQFQDVFTTLCSYAGMDAFWAKQYDKRHESRYALSFVRLGEKWCVFDAYRGLYFNTKDGRIADIEAITKDPSIVSGSQINALTVNGVPYKEFYEGLGGTREPSTPRPQRQMPIPRIFYELRKAIRFEQEDAVSPANQS